MRDIDLSFSVVEGGDERGKRGGFKIIIDHH